MCVCARVWERKTRRLSSAVKQRALPSLAFLLSDGRVLHKTLQAIVLACWFLHLSLCKSQTFLSQPSDGSITSMRVMETELNSEARELISFQLTVKEVTGYKSIPLQRTVHINVSQGSSMNEFRLELGVQNLFATHTYCREVRCVHNKVTQFCKHNVTQCKYAHYTNSSTRLIKGLWHS